MEEVIGTAKEEFYVIGISLAPMAYGIAKNNFRNVPESMTGSVLFAPPGNTEPSQYSIEGE